MTKSASILFTCVGGTMVPALLNELRNKSLYQLSIYGVNASPVGQLTSSLLDEFYSVPSGDDPNYWREIKSILEKNKIDILYVGSDEEAFALSRHKKEINDLGTKVLVSDFEVLNLIEDKAKTYEVLQDSGIEVPEYKVVSDKNGLIAALESFGYPEKTVITKPAKGRGGRGLKVFIGSNENAPSWLGCGAREKRYDELLKEENLEVVDGEKLLVMPALTSPCYDVDILSLQERGSVVAVRERINPAGIPFEGNIFKRNERLEDYCHKVAEVLGLSSLHDMDFMTNNKGEFALLEVNPRPSGSLVGSVKAGVNFIDKAIDALVFNKQVSTPQIDECEIFTFTDVNIVRKKNDKKN